MILLLFMKKEHDLLITHFDEPQKNNGKPKIFQVNTICINTIQIILLVHLVKQNVVELINNLF